MRTKLSFIALALALVFVGCSAQNPSNLISNLETSPGLLRDINSDAALSCISGTDKAAATLADARVLIGSKVDTPFKGNYFQTDSSGCFTLPKEWTDKQPVTIEAAGYIRATFLDIDPHDRDYQLHPKDGVEHNELKGTATGFGTLKKDGFIDFALVMSVMSRFQLNQFSISDLLSPETDTISVFGQSLTMPSNLSLPKQSENYGILSITLDKPIYRSFFRKQDTYRVMAARGKFPFKEVVKELKGGKTLFDVINKLEFLSGGKMDVTIAGAATQKDIATADFVFAPSVTVQAPTFETTQKMVSVLLNHDGGMFVPSDVKALLPQEKVQLKGIAKAQQSVLNILAKERKVKSGMAALEEQMATAVVPATTIVAPVYLSLIAPPTFNGSVVTASVPTLPTGVVAAGLYAVISDVDVTDTADKFYEEKSRLWEVYSSEWVTNVTLPEWPASIGRAVVKRLEVSYLGQGQSSGTSQSGPLMVESSTHATKNSVDF